MTSNVSCNNQSLWFCGEQRFIIVHLTSIISLLTSTCVSFAVLVYQCAIFWDTKFVDRKVADRLVFYLAICYLLYSLTNGLDHAYILWMYDYPTKEVCSALAFLTIDFIIGQTLVATFIAITAFLIIIKGKRMTFRSFDCKLLLPAFCFPMILGTAGLSFGFLGPSGTWWVQHTELVTYSCTSIRIKLQDLWGMYFI